MGAEVEVRNSIRIAGRGVVLLGHVLTGVVRTGQVTAPLALGQAAARPLEVGEVERLSSMESSSPAVGITFRSPPDLDDLRRALPPGRILVLEDPG